MLAGNCNHYNVVREKDSFQVDLRVHEVSQDVICKDEERMTKILTLVDKLQDVYRSNSIINDLKKKCKSNTFSEVSRCIIKEMINIELYELGETIRTIQCLSCLNYSKEGTVYCLCGERDVVGFIFVLTCHHQIVQNRFQGTLSVLVRFGVGPNQ